MSEHRRHVTGPACRRLLAGVLVAAAPVIAANADPRILSVAPGEESWHIRIAGAAEPEFVADDKPLEASRDGESGVWRIDSPPARAERLIVRDGRDTAAVRIGVHDEIRAPFNDWVVYHIMMAYFRNGTPANDKAGFRHWIHPNYAGGDLQGVLQRVDYLAELGINAVWFSPLFASETSHGYDVTNYYAIGEAVGVPGDPEASMALYHRVVDALHERDIRIVLDLPLDYGSGAYDRRAGDPNRRRPRSTGPVQEAEKMWASWGTDFQYWRFNHERTRQFLLEVALYWLGEGRADGLRLDYVRGVPHDFWAELHATVKAQHPDAFLFGEAWQDGYLQGPNAVDIATYYEPVPGTGPQFDGLLDFPMKITMTDVFARGADADGLETWLQRTAALYGPQGRPVYFLDNHDMARFLAWAGTDGKDKLVAALSFMASLSSPMVIFYGTETGILGGGAKAGFTDNGRDPIDWENLDTVLIDRIARILEVRRDTPALARGGRLPLATDDDTLLMMKTHPAGNVLVGVNSSDSERRLSLSGTGLDDGAREFDILLGDTGPKVEGRHLVWTLPPYTTGVVRMRKTAGP